MRRRSLNLLLLLPLLFACATAASRAAAQPANDDARRQAQVHVATASALEKLRDDVGAARVAGDMTVHEFVRRTDSAAELDAALRDARQIGGPRWTDEQTCQIQLEIPGDAVARALSNIAAARPDRSPLRPEELARELKGWRNRSFSATGTSLAANRVDVLKPVRATDWDRISDAIRKQALDAARQDAARRSLDSVRPVELSPGFTVADALAQPEVAQRMIAWFENRPIKTVNFKENLQVDLTLGAPPAETFEQLLGALGNADKLPRDEQAVARARAAFVQRMAEPVGRANVSTGALSVQQEEVEVPEQAPEWVNRQFDAEGSARGTTKRPLSAMQPAQDKAIQNLRAKIGALPLSDGLTIDEAARKDVRIARALDRAMVRARVFKVDYGADGSATVRMTIDPWVVWDEISNAR